MPACRCASNRTPRPKALSGVVKPWQRFRLEARLPRNAEGLEALHTHLVLIYAYAAGGEERLPLGLELFHLLLAFERWASNSPASARIASSHISKSSLNALAQEDARELHGWHPGDEHNAFRVRVEARDGRQILVKETA
jgi:hypothetical protein